MDDKPALTALVGQAIVDLNGHWYGFVHQHEVVTLERAAELHTEGWVVMVDPCDEEALTRWQQIQRSRGIV